MSKLANKSEPLYGKKFRRNDGVCQTFVNLASWGLGADARRTSTELPDPFRVEVGTHPEDVPDEFDEEKWLFNILVIDIRGTKDKKGCTECICDLYNVKIEDLRNATSVGRKSLFDYKGGIFRCEKGSHCKLQKGYNKKQKRRVALKYTISWVDWNQHQVPLKFYILDVTDQVTYNGSEPIHNSLDGTILCAIKPIYGTRKEAGNEEGYAVGMSGCSPKPGYVKSKDEEVLVAEFVHQNKFSTGFMGHCYVYLAEDLPEYFQRYLAILMLSKIRVA
ncbi:hypothetical protein PIB30_090947 [Stylosanthes scabra]|uniref:Stress up-regulated Nod 19 protein n=1 Tax=Stylosanthes scabra TaxID=79078 RepID=A0ABU6ZT46_9FABA|nr:hypothetical protein [Stylosanthes scabra]